MSTSPAHCVRLAPSSPRIVSDIKDDPASSSTPCGSLCSPMDVDKEADKEARHEPTTDREEVEDLTTQSQELTQPYVVNTGTDADAKAMAREAYVRAAAVPGSGGIKPPKKRKRNEPNGYEKKQKVDNKDDTITDDAKEAKEKKPTEPRTMVVALLTDSKQAPPRWKTDAVNVFTVHRGRVEEISEDYFNCDALRTDADEVPFPVDIKVNRKQKSSLQAVEEIKKCLREKRTAKACMVRPRFCYGPKELVLAFGRTVEDDDAYLPVFAKQQEEARIKKEQVKRRDDLVSQIRQMIQTDRLSGSMHLPDRIEDVPAAKAKMTEAARQAFDGVMIRKEQEELARWVYTGEFRDHMLLS